MTHDQSFLGPSGHSVNERVVKEDLLNCMYSFALFRILHYIISIRICYLRIKILISKFDLDSAYRRCHLSGKTASECLTVHEDTLLMALRMTFGGSPCPLSDSIPPPIYLPEDLFFKSAKDLSVNIPPNDVGKVDVYIDYNIVIIPDIGDNHLRAIRAISRPVDTSDDLPRVDIISDKKLKAEGTFEEIKTVLGWVINTRSLLISLPTDKHLKWSEEIQKMINSKRASHSQLESTIGRLNHVAGIIPMFRHFLDCLRHALHRASKVDKFTVL
jgi:hypothetical protein